MSVAEEMQDFAELFGDPTTHIPADPEVVAKLSTIAPEAMQDYWNRFGFSVFQDGWFQFINPETYAPVLKEWTTGTELDDRDEYIAVLRDAFGTIKVWGRNTGYDFTLTPKNGYMDLTKKNNEKSIVQGKGNDWAETMMWHMGLLHYGTPKQKDTIHTQQFAQAREKLGTLGPDQVYGYVPALQLGGEMTAKNLRIEPAPEHLTMLAGISDRAVLSFDDMVKRAFGSDAATSAVNKAVGQDL